MKILYLIFIQLSVFLSIGYSRCSMLGYDTEQILTNLSRMQNYYSARTTNLKTEQIVIPLAFNVIYGDDPSVVSYDEIYEQVEEMNRAYQNTGFTFNLFGVFKHQNKTLSVLPRDIDDNVKRNYAQYAVSSDQVANIYIVENAGDLLGVSTFPDSYSNPADIRFTTFISKETLPGRLGIYNEGKTLVHEIGHWLGLFHTFQGSCTGSDQVQDTPNQSDGDNVYQCNESLNTCGVNDEADPVHNYMNYTDDKCITEFTNGQTARMHLMTNMYKSDFYHAQAKLINYNKISNRQKFISDQQLEVSNRVITQVGSRSEFISPRIILKNGVTLKSGSTVYIGSANKSNTLFRKANLNQSISKGISNSHFYFEDKKIVFDVFVNSIEIFDLKGVRLGNFHVNDYKFTPPPYFGVRAFIAETSDGTQLKGVIQ